MEESYLSTWIILQKLRGLTCSLVDGLALDETPRNSLAYYTSVDSRSVVGGRETDITKIQRFAASFLPCHLSLFGSR